MSIDLEKIIPGFKKIKNDPVSPNSSDSINKSMYNFDLSIKPAILNIFKFKSSHYYLYDAIMDNFYSSGDIYDCLKYDIKEGIDTEYKNSLENVPVKILVNEPIYPDNFYLCDDSVVAVYAEKEQIEIILKCNPSMLDWFKYSTLFLGTGRCIQHSKDFYSSPEDFYNAIVEPYSLADAFFRWGLWD